MAKKQETAVKSAVTREKKRGIIREEKHMLWILLTIILILLYLLWAQGNGWWPFLQQRLGSAFYTNIPASAPAQSTKDTSNTSSSGTNSGTNSGSGSNTGSGNSGGGGSSTTPNGSSTITDLAASVNVGDTKTKVSGQANNLGSGCAIVVKGTAQAVGKQEVCTYSQGNKIVTVTYLNDRVISASKSGF